MSSSDEELPESILSAANTASLNLLPAKSHQKYEKQYKHFESWCNSKGTNSVKEEVFLAYFADLQKTFQPNTLWSKYSMLKCVLQVKRNVDLSPYFKLTLFIKKQNVGYRPKKAKIFNKAEVSRFIEEAPDEIYLLIKVATIFGLARACRREELAKIMIDDIQDKENLVVVKIPDSKNNTSRNFVVSDEINKGLYLQLIRKYTNLRKPCTQHKRFFVQYRQGACSTQCVGINSFGKMPSDIAAYLKLENPEQYTGHSFRRSSATMLADSGEGITNVKRLGGWKSTAVAESYIDESTNQKKDMSNKILDMNKYSNISQPSSSQTRSPSVSHSVSHPLYEMTGSAINLQNTNNCSFVININK